MSLWLHNFVGMCKCLWRFQHFCNIASHKHRHSNQNFSEPCNSNKTCHYQPHHGLLAVSSYAHSKPYAHNNWKWKCFTSTTPHDEATYSLNTKHNLFQNASTKMGKHHTRLNCTEQQITNMFETSRFAELLYVDKAAVIVQNLKIPNLIRWCPFITSGVRR